MTPPLTVDEYCRRILVAVRPLPPRRVLLAEAFGCVLLEEVRAGFDLPPFASSAMDGFALRAEDVASATMEAPVRLAVVAEALMGKPAGVRLGKGEAIVVPTGAVMPEGADTVVPIEDCIRRGDRVWVTAPAPKDRHVRSAGEDLNAGELVIEPGRPLSAADLGALAAAGAARVTVVPRARVGILSTGDELVRPAGALGAGQIYDSNAFMLAGQVREAGAEPVDLGRLPDDPDVLLSALDAAHADVDAFVCSGGVSAGENDPVKRAFASGGEICCVEVAIQPGRPQAFGIRREKPFFGLPGNPLAALVGFEVFVRPGLRRMTSLDEHRPAVAATLDGDVGAHIANFRFVPARLRQEAGTLIASPQGGRRSNLIAGLARADALVEVPPGSALTAGMSCRVRVLRGISGN